jgi:DNA replication and repair protein RecF
MPCRPVKAAALTRLTLTDFRNYSGLRLDTRGGPVVLTGANGAGKTNLLEAISLLAPGRGLRGAAFEDLARIDGPASWAVASEIEGPSGATALGTAWASGAAARQVRIAGEAHKSSGAFSDHLRILWLTPAMDRCSPARPATGGAFSTASSSPSTPSMAPGCSPSTS